MDRFWLVWNERGHSPTFKHETPMSARAEAERLAKNNPGHAFHVLAHVGTCSKNDVVWVKSGRDLDDDIPF